MIKRLILDYDTVPEIVTCDIYEYRGRKDFNKVKSIEAVVDTSDFTITFLGELFPNLEKLKLNNSITPNVRDIGCNFSKLKFLSLAKCQISDFSGVSAVAPNLIELYAAGNQISDVSDLIGMDKLKILDLEDNSIKDTDTLNFLQCCASLQALTLSGNPVKIDDQGILKILPNLIYFNEHRIGGGGPGIAALKRQFLPNEAKAAAKNSSSNSPAKESAKPAPAAKQVETKKPEVKKEEPVKEVAQKQQHQKSEQQQKVAQQQHQPEPQIKSPQKTQPNGQDAPKRPQPAAKIAEEKKLQQKAQTQQQTQQQAQKKEEPKTVQQQKQQPKPEPKPQEATSKAQPKTNQTQPEQQKAKPVPQKQLQPEQQKQVQPKQIEQKPQPQLKSNPTPAQSQIQQQPQQVQQAQKQNTEKVQQPLKKQEAHADEVVMPHSPTHAQKQVVIASPKGPRGDKPLTAVSTTASGGKVARRQYTPGGQSSLKNENKRAPPSRLTRPTLRSSSNMDSSNPNPQTEESSFSVREPTSTSSNSSTNNTKNAVSSSDSHNTTNNSANKPQKVILNESNGTDQNDIGSSRGAGRRVNVKRRKVVVSSQQAHSMLPSIHGKDERIVTEYVDDIVEDRPPSTRGQYERSILRQGEKNFSPRKNNTIDERTGMPRYTPRRQRDEDIEPTNPRGHKVIVRPMALKRLV